MRSVDRVSRERVPSDCASFGLGLPSRIRYRADVLILAIILFGMVAGGIAQLLMGRLGRRIDWQIALVAGLTGSFVGGLLISLIAGDGLSLRPSGMIGSILGALVVTGAWLQFDQSKAAEARRDRRR